MSDVILVNQKGRGSKEREGERKRKLSDKFFCVYISPKLHKLSLAEGMTAALRGPTC